jgi:hypothetical protein
MTLNSTLIQAAFREVNFIEQGATPTTDEQTEALRLLQSLVDSLMGSTVGIKYRPWHIPDPFNTAPDNRRYPAISDSPNVKAVRDLAYPPMQSRVILRNDTVQTLYFQSQPLDGAIMSIVDAGFTANVTLDANGMFFGTSGLTRTEVIEPRAEGRNLTREYVFREDTASWNQTSALTYGGEMPYPSQFDDYWITALALRLTPSFGAKQAEVTMGRFKEMTSFIRGWYRQHQEVLIGDAGTPSEQSFYSGLYGGDPDRGAFT